MYNKKKKTCRYLFENLSYQRGHCMIVGKKAEEAKIATNGAGTAAIASLVSDEELSADDIIPAALDKRVGPAVAKAVAEAARRSGAARI